MRIANRWIGSIGIGLLCVGFLVGYFTGEAVMAKSYRKLLDAQRERADDYWEMYCKAIDDKILER